jgi:hypothetical protein
MGVIAAHWDDAAGVALGLCVGPAKAGAPGRSIVLPAPGGARRRSGRHGAVVVRSRGVRRSGRRRGRRELLCVTFSGFCVWNVLGGVSRWG